MKQDSKYDEKKKLLQELFDEVTVGDPSMLHKHVLNGEYIIRKASIAIDGTPSIAILGIRIHDSAIVLFDREMEGSGGADYINVFDSPPILEIIPEYEKIGYYWQLKASNKNNFSRAIKLFRQAAILMERFCESYSKKKEFLEA